MSVICEWTSKKRRVSVLTQVVATNNDKIGLSTYLFFTFSRTLSMTNERSEFKCNSSCERKYINKKKRAGLSILY